ncbi:MAG: pyridoxamine 5'-phosphate oxidase [Acidobacteria bacterium]|nr:pyridoxamine 5'-phosphate oxidase [Acidobacteriota bacterium]
MIDKRIQKLSKQRREYFSIPMDESSVDADPIIQFDRWFDEVLSAGQPDPDAMTLSTATADGVVSARVVLLRDFDHRGFVFFTNYQSRKARELAAIPRAALTFFWFSHNRQVRIEGTVEKVSNQESEEYFQTRPRGSQLGAWASPQSDEIADRHTLDESLAEVESRFNNRPVPCPPFWGGYRVKPEKIEFWQGRENRLHDRILYTLHHSEWRISRLAP